MKSLVSLTALVGLLGCGDLTPDAKVADGVCTMYCDMCAQIEVDECASICLDQWATYGIGPNAECANGAYLASLTCQIENGCGDERCGDPYLDMLRCIENTNEE